MGWFYLCSVVVFLMMKGLDTQSTDHQVCMLVPASTHACFKSFENKGQLSAKISCLQDLMWNIVPDTLLKEKDRSFLRNLSSIIGVESMQRPSASRMGDIGMSGSFQASGQSTSRYPANLHPPSGKRTRKEYRTLSPVERQRFHRALKRLYLDGIIDIFANIHAAASDMHHQGTSFLPWHRVYITMFEEMLRIYDPEVSLPYWASWLDDVMDNPVNSILWTSEYFGNGDGIVTSGPAAYWVTEQGGLQRDFGKASSLFKKEQINRVLTQCYLANISRPSAPRIYDLEGYHGGPHVWVGGDMSAFTTTGYDPVFYMHHAYVDYVWEKFRSKQRTLCGVDPSTDYPDVPVGNSNHPDAPMTGFEWFTNRVGIKSQWTDNWYRYEQEPECPDCCPKCPFPAPLYCDYSRNTCVSRSKLIDQLGQINQDVAFSMSARSAGIASGQQERPRNRGRLFDAPPNDGRTVSTAIQDAMTAAPQSHQQQFSAFL